MIKNLLLIGIGGFAGSVARYAVSTLVSVSSLSGLFPWGTFSVNVSGSLLIGVILSLAGQGSWYYLGIIGFCGGFTTFSAFSAELLVLIRGGNWAIALGYVLSSVILCVMAVALGMYIIDRIK